MGPYDATKMSVSYVNGKSTATKIAINILPKKASRLVNLTHFPVKISFIYIYIYIYIWLILFKKAIKFPNELLKYRMLTQVKSNKTQKQSNAFIVKLLEMYRTDHRNQYLKTHFYNNEMA